MSNEVKNNFLHNIDKRVLETNVANYLSKFEDGELYLEDTENEIIVIENGYVKSIKIHQKQGAGLRGIIENSVYYSSCDGLLEGFEKKLYKKIEKFESKIPKSQASNPNEQKNNFYPSNQENSNIQEKITKLLLAEQFIRKHAGVINSSVSLAIEHKNVGIIPKDGSLMTDFRPLIRINISVTLQKNKKIETGVSGFGGRDKLENFLNKEALIKAASNAINQAETNLEAEEIKAGSMEVALGNGWPGILLHEAIGHGLEGDFIYKKSSVFTEMLGKRVAAKGINVVDNGTIQNRRGSLNFDDEGNSTSKNVLIEDGILVGFMHDKISAKNLGVKPTGNGRREDYSCPPMPRMTNTYMENGTFSEEEIIASIKNGIYAKEFGGGQVDITSGQFVFSCTLAYKVQNGKILHPIKGVTLIGEGHKALLGISMVGSNMELDSGIGTCGKNSQGVPVGVGQPTVKLDSLSVGGTKI